MRAGTPRKKPNKIQAISKKRASPSQVQPADTQPDKTNGKKLPARISGANSLLSIICRDPRLDQKARTAIRSAHSKGLSIGDLGALTAYAVIIAQESNTLDTKDFLITVQKAASHVAAAVQLAQETIGDGATRITVEFVGDGPTSSRPEAMRATRRDVVVGDLIDAE